MSRSVPRDFSWIGLSQTTYLGPRKKGGETPVDEQKRETPVTAISSLLKISTSPTSSLGP